MKVLIVRFSSIGDIVLTTPLARCLKTQLPGAEIHYLTKQQFLPVLAGNPYLDKIFTIHSRVGEVLASLRAEKYDFIVDLHKNLRSWQVLLCLLRPFGTFSKLNIRKLLMCRFKIDLLPRVHIVDRYFRAVRRLGVNNDGLGLDYYIPPGTNPWQKIPVLPAEGFIALVIGGKHATKQLPPRKLLDLCQLLHSPIVILGGEEDRAAGDYILEHFKHTNGQGPVNTCGLLSLDESAALLDAATSVITHDTGLMHIAAALHKNITSVWGNTIPAFGMYPYFPDDYQGKSTLVEVDGLACRPCSRIGYKHCPKSHFRCMLDIPLEKVGQ